MKKSLLMGAVLGVVFGVVMWSAPAHADVFSDIKEKLACLFTELRGVIYIAAGLAFIGFAVAGMFGKIEWKKVAVLCAGLFLVVIAAAAIEWLVGDMPNLSC